MRSQRALAEAERGSVAPLVALSLFALIGVGGIAFDYARLASVDTELQQAADQAALAAATQLDRQPGSTTRAVDAAQAMLNNETRFAFNSQTPELRVATGDTDTTDANNPVARVTFYSTKADAEANTNGYPASAAADLTARYVQVAVTGRKAIYALTPIVGAVASGTINARAAAGLGSAICKVPPVMMCNPTEPENNKDKDYAFDGNALKGYGVRLVSVGNGNNAWAPGNFGYLDVGSDTSNPNVQLRQALGWLNVPGDCSGVDGVQTRTGANTTVTQAINTRFDIYDRAVTGNGNNIPASCPPGGSCPPSINTIKDVSQKGTPNAANKCGFANNEWELAADADAYRPTSTAALTATQLSAIKLMGLPRDRCHAVSLNGVCTYNNGTATKIGSGDWDRDAYFKSNYGLDHSAWQSALAGGAVDTRIPSIRLPTRYEVYKWEIANRGTVLGSRAVLSSRVLPGGSGPNAPTAFDGPVCSPLQTPSTSGVVPGGANVDRRRISAAVINCNANDVHGGSKTTYPVLKWLEMFLVEPSLNRGSGGNQRTDPNDVYVEIIGETKLGADATAGQVVRRDKPYLVR